eukprot:60895-Prorocentrum_minimum.AAC.1
MCPARRKRSGSLHYRSRSSERGAGHRGEETPLVGGRFAGRCEALGRSGAEGPTRARALGGRFALLSGKSSLTTRA